MGELASATKRRAYILPSAQGNVPGKDELSFELRQESAPTQLHFYNVPPVLLPKVKEVQQRVNEYLKSVYQKMVAGFEADRAEMQDDTDQAMLYAVTAIINVMEWHTGNIARIKMWREEEVARIRQEEAALREAAIEIKAQELAREALAKATQAENLAMAFENSLALMLQENEAKTARIAQLEAKLEEVGRAKKMERVQFVLGHEKKPKRAKTRGLENYE